MIGAFLVGFAVGAGVVLAFLVIAITVGAGKEEQCGEDKIK